MQFQCQRSYPVGYQGMHDIISNMDGAVDHGLILCFAKTFDKVPNWRLIYKLDYYRIRWCTTKFHVLFLYLFVFSNSEINFGIVLENVETN